MFDYGRRTTAKDQCEVNQFDKINQIRHMLIQIHARKTRAFLCFWDPCDTHTDTFLLKFLDMLEYIHSCSVNHLLG